MPEVNLKGKHVSGNGWVSKKWTQICEDHQEQFPAINTCVSGSFNIQILDGSYVPPGDELYRRVSSGNYISPRAKVIKINDKEVEAWIYCGGHPGGTLELLSADRLCVKLEDSLEALDILIQEVPEGTEGMPQVPYQEAPAS